MQNYFTFLDLITKILIAIHVDVTFLDQHSASSPCGSSRSWYPFIQNLILIVTNECHENKRQKIKNGEVEILFFCYNWILLKNYFFFFWSCAFKICISLKKYILKQNLHCNLSCTFFLLLFELVSCSMIKAVTSEAQTINDANMELQNHIIL